MPSNKEIARPPSVAPIAKFVHIAISSGVVLAFLATTLGALPSLSWSYPWKNTVVEQTITRVFPQGWGFFTRSSQEPIVTPWNSEGESLSQLPTARISNAFGLNREGRAQGVEMGTLQSQIAEQGWVPCPDQASIPECLGFSARNAHVSHKIDSFTREPSLCGEVTLLQTEPVDYMYRKYFETNVKPTQFVKLSISC
ncbi:SdpA family antimicrobial peptide system protein [Corynebacterium sp. Marseille-Q2823]|uniref:SdpA family antimicrobial peptide system protein n=1 Tax=Corynebacterium sp. Marseille-Q2823 TaxID=2736606 RepID=UPI00158B57B0